MPTRCTSRLGILIASLLAAACGGDDGDGSTSGTTTTTTTTPVELPPPLEPLAPVQSTETERFRTSEACAQCHLDGDAQIIRDAAGEDVSAVRLWRSSMMAFAARDPYYLAVFSEELAALPDAAAEVEQTCTRCHAPAGSLEHEQTGGHLTFDALTAGSTPEANLGRDGVACSMCHQIQDTFLGDVESFAGGFRVGYGREIYGPHQGVNTNPMNSFINFNPVYSAHVQRAELCATCHTVITPVRDAAGAPTGGDFLEQAPYLEWLNSNFGPMITCQSCHLPTEGDDMLPLSLPIAKYPDNLGARQPFGQHRFVGGNAYMLGLLSDNVAWTGSDVAPVELQAAAARGEEHLRGYIEVSIEGASLSGDLLDVTVRVQNHAGHKFPTGYPSRRAWIHLRAESGAGEALFESGAVDAAGALVDVTGRRLDPEGALMPHFEEITAPDQVQIYEAVAGDASNAPTHRALAAAKYLKDNRLLPDGWSPSGPWTEWTTPVGVGDDPTFAAGEDRVVYRVPGGAGVRRLVVELLFQSVPPAALDHLAVVPTPAAVAFSDMARRRAPTPVVMAQASIDL